MVLINMQVAYPSKFQRMFTGLKNENKLCLEIDEKIIICNNQVKMLGIRIDSKLEFDTRVKAVCF